MSRIDAGRHAAECVGGPTPPEHSCILFSHGHTVNCSKHRDTQHHRQCQVFRLAGHAARGPGRERKTAPCDRSLMIYHIPTAPSLSQTAGWGLRKLPNPLPHPRRAVPFDNGLGPGRPLGHAGMISPHRRTAGSRTTAGCECRLFGRRSLSVPPILLSALPLSRRHVLLSLVSRPSKIAQEQGPRVKLPGVLAFTPFSSACSAWARETMPRASSSVIHFCIRRRKLGSFRGAAPSRTSPRPRDPWISLVGILGKGVLRPCKTRRVHVQDASPSMEAQSTRTDASTSEIGAWPPAPRLRQPVRPFEAQPLMPCDASDQRPAYQGPSLTPWIPGFRVLRAKYHPGHVAGRSFLDFPRGRSMARLHPQAPSLILPWKAPSWHPRHPGRAVCCHMPRLSCQPTPLAGTLKTVPTPVCRSLGFAWCASRTFRPSRHVMTTRSAVREGNRECIRTHTTLYYTAPSLAWKRIWHFHDTDRDWRPAAPTYSI